MTLPVWLLIALPLAGAAVLLLGGRATNAWGHLLGCAAVLASFVVGVVLFVDLLNRTAEDRMIHEQLFSWVPVGQPAGRLRPPTRPAVSVFRAADHRRRLADPPVLVGYMAHDPERRRFFAYLNLFVAAMLLLVLADNYLGLYVGWEGVGLASYLLIGFWSHKPSAATAAKKAFVVNRVGDIGLALALMVMFANVGTISYAGVFGAADQMSEGTLTAIGLLLLLAACGKSAQVPLQSWLGDAMEGPTPVSALIHAATMVTAGVYLIVRSGPVYDLAPDARLGVVIVGAVTLLFGAVIGCAKDDIKKALAASTMTQIGYMVLAAGLGPAGYAIAIMHLLTHGFFKAGPVPRRRLGDARHGRRNRHAPLRRTAQVHADHVRDVRARLPRDHRRAAVRRLLLQGRHHRNRLRRRRSQGLPARRRGAARRGHHRVLHDAGDADDVLR